MIRITSLLALTAISAFAAPARAVDSASVTPVDRIEEKTWGGMWKARHELLVKRANENPAGISLVFVGDSITQGWEGAGKAEWQKRFAKYGALNLGISGDRTENVLWRLRNGEWPAALKPKVAVVMIGTNNMARPATHTPEGAAEGVKRIVEEILARSPGTRVILHPVFPRGATPSDAHRLMNDKTNAIVAKLGERPGVSLLDIGGKFLDAKGGLSKAVMPDLLHPNAKGYAIWGAALEPEVAKLIPSAEKNDAR